MKYQTYNMNHLLFNPINLQKIIVWTVFLPLLHKYDVMVWLIISVLDGIF